MKASKNFATENGQSHLPSQMHHTTADVMGVDSPDQHVVLLTLGQCRASDYVLKVRMSPREARLLAAALLKAADDTTSILPVIL
jgi:hypothetical protein